MKFSYSTDLSKRRSFLVSILLFTSSDSTIKEYRRLQNYILLSYSVIILYTLVVAHRPYTWAIDILTTIMILLCEEEERKTRIKKK